MAEVTTAAAITGAAMLAAEAAVRPSGGNVVGRVGLEQRAASRGALASLLTHGTRSACRFLCEKFPCFVS